MRVYEGEIWIRIGLSYVPASTEASRISTLFRMYLHSWHVLSYPTLRLCFFGWIPSSPSLRFSSSSSCKCHSSLVNSTTQLHSAFVLNTTRSPKMAFFPSSRPATCGAKLKLGIGEVCVGWIKPHLAKAFSTQLTQSRRSRDNNFSILLFLFLFPCAQVFLCYA